MNNLDNLDMSLQRLAQRAKDQGIRATARKMGVNPMRVSRVVSRLADRSFLTPVSLEDVCSLADAVGARVSIVL